MTTCTNGRAEMLKLFAGTSGAGREHYCFDGTVSANPATGKARDTGQFDCHQSETRSLEHRDDLQSGYRAIRYFEES